MRKYWQIFKISWQNTLVYRLNFFMWRLRSTIGFFATYIFWLAIVSSNHQIGSYNQSTLLTYIFVSGFLRNWVISNVSYSICAEIATGDLNNYLLRPLNYFKNWLARDFADKILNLIFFLAEITIFYFILRPVLVLPHSFFQLISFLMISALAALVYFFLSFLVSTYAFWHPEHNGWPMRFIFLTLLDFLSGSSIPLDIFPPVILKILQALPFSYLIFFPVQIWLNRVDPAQIINLFLVTALWLIALYFMVKFVWRRGLRIYGAYGR